MHRKQSDHKVETGGMWPQPRTAGSYQKRDEARRVLRLRLQRERDPPRPSLMPMRPWTAGLQN